ncbi:MAG: TlpA disulfide reductase family protein [Chitinophagaceae bacterium]
MKKIVLFLLLCPFIVFAQPVKPKPVAKGFTIEGKMEGYADGTQIRLYKSGENIEMTSAKLLKSKFVLKGSLPEPTLCFLMIGDRKPVEVFVENTVISVKGKKVEPPVYDIEGSPSHKVFAGFIKTFLPLAQQLNTLANSINTTMPGAERDALMTTYTNLQENLQKEIDKLVVDKPKSPVSAFVLNATYQFNEDIIVLERRFNLLDASVRNSETGKSLEQFIAEKKIGAVGTQSLDFTQPDTTGTPVSLSSFRGKYVLVDFWASWCGPCRSENPNVVENFNKFSSKNFTVLSVSLDRPGQKDKWLDAIKADNLNWTHVSDLQFWSNAVAQLYHIQSIPQNILVDPDGKIIAKNLRGPALQAKLCELFGCN